MTKPRMLITGGSGYLGGWVVRLARPGWSVTATYLAHPIAENENEDEDEGEGEAEPGVTWRRLDVRDRVAVRTLVDQVRPAAIVHTAASNPGQRADFETTNTVGTRHVARAAAACGARLIHMSSDVVFDGQRGNYVEEDPPNPITPYGRSKALAEEEVRASGAQAVIVRTSLIYGWRPRLDRTTRWVVDSLRTENPAYLFTDELRCPIWVETLAAAVVELAGLDYPPDARVGVLHVAGAQPLSRYEFGVRLLRFLGLDPGPVVPARSRESGLCRPLDCTLDCSRARALLRTPLPGVDEVLRQRGPDG